MLIVCVIGMILTLNAWRRYPRASRLAFFGLLLILLNVVGSALWFAFLTGPGRPGPAINLGTWLTVSSLVFAFLQAGGIGLLLAAVFAGREQQLAPGFAVLSGIAQSPPPLPRPVQTHGGQDE
jgi:hypothetical protein